jgi:hypothetical protein
VARQSRAARLANSSRARLAAAATAAGSGESLPGAVASWAGRQQGDRDAACLAGGELGPEAGGDLGGVAELADRRQGGLGRRQPCRPVRVHRVQQPGAQLGHDARMGPGWAGQPRGDLGQVALDRRPGGRFR